MEADKKCDNSDKLLGRNKIEKLVISDSFLEQ